MSLNMVITVSQLNSYIKSSFDSDSNLKNIFIKGEISNFKNNYQSEHKYFSLKDGKSIVRCVMFANVARRLRFNITDGMMVIVRGSVSSYEASGQYQIYVEDMQPDGLGSIYLKIEQLKDKLKSEGLFSQERKKPVPEYPSTVGVVTSASGSVLYDIKNVMSRRYPSCRIIVYPVKVQGESSEYEIINGIKYLNKMSLCDVIIVARGGGSAEELNSFNDENVAREVANSNIPVISAVGHETDFTICDFVADLRAPTPSVAAELAVPDKEELGVLIKSLKKRMSISLQKKISSLKEEVTSNLKVLHYFSPAKTINSRKDDIKFYKSKLNTVFLGFINLKLEEIKNIKDKLEVMNPMNVLSRGYSVVTLGDKNVTSVKELSRGERVKLVFSDGEVYCKID